MALLIVTPDSKPRRTFKEWITAFIENDEEEEALYRAQLYKQRAEEGDEFLGTNPDSRDDSHNDGYYDDLDMDIDESILEGLIIFCLAATLLVLIYIRQQRNRPRPNENGANPGAPGNDDRGFFPQPEEPEFRQWVAGGIGH